MRTRQYYLIILVVFGLLGLSGCATLFGEDTEEAPKTAGTDTQENLDRAPAWYRDAQTQLREKREKDVEEPPNADERKERIQAAMDEGDIVVGMSPRQVIEAWGEPREVESAGDPRSGNQRWTYYNGISTHYITSERQVLFFENGHVVGWKTVHP